MWVVSEFESTLELVGSLVNVSDLVAKILNSETSSGLQADNTMVQPSRKLENF